MTIYTVTCSINLRDMNSEYTVIGSNKSLGSAISSCANSIIGLAVCNPHVRKLMSNDVNHADMPRDGFNASLKVYLLRVLLKDRCFIMQDFHDGDPVGIGIVRFDIAKNRLAD